MSYSKISFSIVFFLFSVFAMAQGKDNFPTWQKGYLDIHHINTGRGNCAFIVFPDGTNMMIDAGDFDAAAFDNAYAPMYSPPMFPNAGYTTGGAVYNYVSQILNTKKIAIDYFLLTHFHGDHYGAVREGLHKSEKGNYLLTGLTEVGDLMQIKKLVDRNYPDYNFPIDLRTEKNNPTFKNYLDFVDYHKKHGMQVEQLVVGAKNQFVLKNNPKEFPNFEVRNIKSNNIVWTGKSGETKTLFTKNQLLDKNGRYSENPLSTAIVIKYGNFAYFSGGDNTGLEDQDREKWQDIETPMAEL